MKKMLFFSVLIVAAICFTSGQALAGGSVNFYYGARTFDSDDLSVTASDVGFYDPNGEYGVDIDSGREFAINADFGGENWPVNIFVGIYLSDDDESLSVVDRNWTLSDGTNNYPAQSVAWGNLEVETREIRLGVKKAFKTVTNFIPFVMGGVAYVSGEAKVSAGEYIESEEADFKEEWWADSYSDDDSAIGYWLGGGVYYQFAQRYNLGFELSYSAAEVSIEDRDFETGGLHYGLFVGYQW